jgi:chaperone required for assembly of F1-ATPase
LTGSVLLTLAFAHGQLDTDAAWTAGMLDDLWSLEVWGHDEEAALRLAQRRREFDAASAFLAATA